MVCCLFCIISSFYFSFSGTLELKTESTVVIHWYEMCHKATCDYRFGWANVIINWTKPKLWWFGGKQDYWWLELVFNDVNVIIVLENNNFHLSNRQFSSLLFSSLLNRAGVISAKLISLFLFELVSSTSLHIFIPFPSFSPSFTHVVLSPLWW